MNWTDERVEKLKKLWSEGLSASQIAAQLGGVSRNAVIGKVHRLNLPGRAKAGSAPASARTPKRTPTAPRAPSFTPRVATRTVARPAGATMVHGAHSRPLARRVAPTEKAFWLAGDWGRDDHGNRHGQAGLAEVGGGVELRVTCLTAADR